MQNNTSSKPRSKNIFSSHVYKTAHEGRNFNSVSFIDKMYKPGGDIKSSCTQTSKTVISLPVTDMDTTRMSPDSLSPREDMAACINEDNCDKNHSFAPYSRQNCVLNYLEQIRLPNEVDSRLSSGDSLVKTFLEKNKNRQDTTEKTTTNPLATRATFLQQTSPLRKLDKQETLRSQSYVEGPSQQVKKPQIFSPRFKVSAIKEKLAFELKQLTPWHQSPVDLKIDLNSGKNSPQKTPRSSSFMSPTFSSEQKNQMIDIKSVRKLISPTRRGRSVSPNYMKAHEVKVPYIDKSNSTIFVENAKSVIQLPNNDSSDVSSCNASVGSVGNSCPEGMLLQAITKLRESEWNSALRGLAEIVEICKVHDTDLIYPHMTLINQRIIELLKNLRSHVCRTTCQAVGHIFEHVKDTRRPEFDELVDTLLCRTADSNKFIRHDANLALDCMVTHIPVLHSVRALSIKGPEHKNPLVRTATARLIVCAVVLASPQIILNPNSNEHTRRRVILNMVRFLNDKSPDVRKFGVRLYKLMAADRLFEIYLKRYLEKETILQLKACLKFYNTKK